MAHALQTRVVASQVVQLAGRQQVTKRDAESVYQVKLLGQPLQGQLQLDAPQFQAAGV